MMSNISRKRRIALASAVTGVVLVGLTTPAANAVTGFWDGSTDNDWGTTSNWSTTVVGGVDVASVPTTGETANFSITSLTAAQSINLNADRSIASLAVASTATGGITLLGGSVDRTLTLTNSISIGATGGPVTIGSTTSGQAVNISSGTLGINNQSANLLSLVNNYTGSGTTSITNSGTGGVTFGGNLTGAGGLTVNTTGGTVTFNGSLGISTFTLSRGNVVITGANGTSNVNSTVGNNGVLNLDDRGVTNANRYDDARTLTLNNGSQFRYFGNDSANSTESIGALSFGTGVGSYNVTRGTGAAATVTHASLTARAANTGGLGFVNGDALGTTGGSSARVLFTAAPSGAAFVGTTNGTGAVNSGVFNTRIVPHLLGESAGGVGTATGTANTFLTYDATAGLRPLDLATEFANNSIASGNNTYLTSATTAGGSTSINSLILGTGGSLDIATGQTVTNASNALRFNGSASINGGTYGLGAGEGLVTLASGATGTVRSDITGSGASLSVFGPGTLRLTGNNSYAGFTSITGGATVAIGSNSAFGTSVVQGSGTIRADNRARTITNKVLGNSTIGTSPTIGGSNDLTFAGNGSSPAMSIQQSLNSNFVVNNTGTTTVSGTFALTDNASGSQNNGPFFTLGSSTNVVITGAIQDNRTGNVASAQAVTALSFTGTGSNLTINPTATNNNFGATKGFLINVVNPGYNTVTIGGPGGTGASITPFGAGTFQPNNTTAFYLKAATSGQVLMNAYNPGGSAIGFGFAGDNDLTWGATFTTGSTAQTISNIADAKLTFANTLTLGSNLTILGTGDTVFSSTSTLGPTAARTLTVTSTGKTTLAGVNNLTGNQSFNGGTVVLDYSASNANRLNQAATVSQAALSLGGNDLVLKGGTHTQGLGSTNGTTFTNGASTITRDGGTSTIALGNLARAANNGAVVDLQSGVASTTSAGANGILGGYATVGQADWAVGGGAISALSSYAALTNSATTNALVTGNGSVTTTTTINSLKVDTTAAGQSLAINTSISLIANSGGLLFVGDNDYAITGGTLRPNTSTSTDLVVHTHGDGVLTIGSLLINGSGSSALTKTGAGTLVLTNASNTYNGGVNLLGGVLQVSSSGNLNAGGTINFNAGTLRNTASFDTLSRGISFHANGGTFDVADGTTLTTSVGFNTSTGVVGFTKTGDGTLLINAAAGSYNGETNINAGTVKLGNATALGASSTGSNRSNAPTFVNGGTLDLNGFTSNIGNFTLTSGTVADLAGGGQLNAYSINLKSGSVDAALGDVIVTGNTNGNATNLYKSTAGTATLTRTNVYSGSTQIAAGTLQIGDGLTTGTLGTANVTMTGGTLSFKRSNAYVVNNAITGGGAVSQIGSGTTSLTAPNSYTAGTSVTSGTLLAMNIEGSATGSGAVNVTSGGTLGGTGFIVANNANVTIASGAHLSPGASAGVLTLDLGTGTLNISGAVGAAASASQVFELATAATSDRVLITNALSALTIGAGTLNFDDFAFTTLAGFAPGTYTLFETNAPILGSLGGSLSGLLGGLTGELSITDANTDLILTVTETPAVPEPGTMAVLATVACGLLARRRR